MKSIRMLFFSAVLFFSSGAFASDDSLLNHILCFSGDSQDAILYSMHHGRFVDKILFHWKFSEESQQIHFYGPFGSVISLKESGAGGFYLENNSALSQKTGLSRLSLLGWRSDRVKFILLVLSHTPQHITEPYVMEVVSDFLRIIGAAAVGHEWKIGPYIFRDLKCLPSNLSVPSIIFDHKFRPFWLKSESILNVLTEDSVVPFAASEPSCYRSSVWAKEIDHMRSCFPQIHWVSDKDCVVSSAGEKS